MPENFENFQNQFKPRNSLIVLFSSNMTLFFQYCCKRDLKIKDFLGTCLKILYASVCVIFQKTKVERI